MVGGKQGRGKFHAIKKTPNFGDVDFRKISLGTVNQGFSEDLY